jgi:hypothetical protein
MIPSGDVHALLARSLSRSQFKEPGDGFPPGFEYRWGESASKKPLRVSSPEYVDYVMTWVEDQIDNEEIFPTLESQQFPKDFLEYAKVRVWFVRVCVVRAELTRRSIFLFLSCPLHRVASPTVRSPCRSLARSLAGHLQAVIPRLRHHLPPSLWPNRGDRGGVAHQHFAQALRLLRVRVQPAGREGAARAQGPNRTAAGRVQVAKGVSSSVARVRPRGLSPLSRPFALCLPVCLYLYPTNISYPLRPLYQSAPAFNSVLFILFSVLNET